MAVGGTLWGCFLREPSCPALPRGHWSTHWSHCMTPDRLSTTSLPTTFQPGRNIIFAEIIFNKKMLLGQAEEKSVSKQVK